MLSFNYANRARALVLCAVFLLSPAILSMDPGATIVPRPSSGARRASDPFASDFEGSPRSGKSPQNNRPISELIGLAHGGLLCALVGGESYARTAAIAPEGNGYCRRITPERFFLEDVIKPIVRGIEPAHAVWFAAQSGASAGAEDRPYTVENVLAFLADPAQGEAFLEQLREFERAVNDDPRNLLRQDDEGVVKIEADLRARLADPEFVETARKRLVNAIRRVGWLMIELSSEREPVEEPRLVTPGGGEPAAGGEDAVGSDSAPVTPDEARFQVYSDALTRFFKLDKTVGGAADHK